MRLLFFLSKKNQINRIRINYVILNKIPKESAAEVHTEEEHTENRTQINKEELKKEVLNKDLGNTERVKGITEAEALELLDEVIEDTELKELYLEYIKVREEINTPLTLRGLRLLIARCERLSEFNIGLQKTMLESACIHQWKSVYPPAADDKGRNATLENFGKILFGNN